MKILRVFSGIERQNTFYGVTFPMPAETAEKITFDVCQTDCRIVPYEYERGSYYFTESSEQLRHKKALDIVWTLYGTKREVVHSMCVVADYVAKLEKFMKDIPFHSAFRVLFSDNPMHKTDEVPRLVMIRVFRNEDFDCREHPEMLNGMPIGTYHCPECANMQVAGLIHMRDDK